MTCTESETLCKATKRDGCMRTARRQASPGTNKSIQAHAPQALWLCRVAVDSAELAALHFDRDIVISRQPRVRRVYPQRALRAAACPVSRLLWQPVLCRHPRQACACHQAHMPRSKSQCKPAGGCWCLCTRAHVMRLVSSTRLPRPADCRSSIARSFRRSHRRAQGAKIKHCEGRLPACGSGQVAAQHC